mgnify:CR=1 FL=1
MQDPAAQKALITALGLIAKLTARVTALEETAMLNTGPVDANSQRLINVATPIDATDAVNLQTLRDYVASQVESF